MKTAQLYALLDEAYAMRKHHVIPHIIGRPGVGKTQRVLQWADDRDMEVIQFVGSTLSPTDVFSYMPDTKKGMLVGMPNARLPWQHTRPDFQGVIFVDEFAQMHPEVQKQWAKLINEGAIDGHKLAEGAALVLASNGHRDGAGANKLLTLINSRVTAYDMPVDNEETVGYFSNKGYPAELLAYMHTRPFEESDFLDKAGRPHEGQFYCPRTMEQAIQRYVYRQKNGMTMSVLDWAANVGTGRAVELAAFLEMTQKLPQPAEILADPKGTRVPEKLDERAAVVALLTHHTTAATLPKVREYLTRYELPLQVLYLKLVIRQPDVLKSATLAKWVKDTDMNGLLLSC